MYTYIQKSINNSKAVIIIILQNIAMIEGIVLFINQLLTFYIPTFYTFKFLMNNNTPKIRTVLKFWCVLSIYHLLQWVLSQVIAQKLFPVIDLVVLVGLNWKEMEYAELVFDAVIGPSYRNNRQSLQKVTNQIEKIFNKKTAKLKQKVADSTTQKFKGIIGEILVGALNPNMKRKSSESEKEESVQNDQDDEQKDQ